MPFPVRELPVVAPGIMGVVLAIDYGQKRLGLALSDEHFPTNIGNPHEITILEFAERIRTLLESKMQIVFEPLPQDDPKQRCPDISKAKRLFGW